MKIRSLTCEFDVQGSRPLIVTFARPIAAWRSVPTASGLYKIQATSVAVTVHGRVIPGQEARGERGGWDFDLPMSEACLLAEADSNAFLGRALYCLERISDERNGYDNVGRAICGTTTWAPTVIQDVANLLRELISPR